MTEKTIRTADDVWEPVARHFPEFSPEEQHAGIVLLRELAGGEAVSAARLAEVLGTPVDQAEAFLRDSQMSPFVDADEAGRVTSFWGLASTPTHHRFTLDGQPLWTWCAVDTLFLPKLLDRTARIESEDPETGELVRLTVSPTDIETADPEEGVVVSMTSPEAWDVSAFSRMLATFCHFVFFFTSRASGERWVAKHPETVLLSLEEAFEWGKRHSARAFGTELARRREDDA